MFYSESFNYFTIISGTSERFVPIGAWHRRRKNTKWT